MSITAGQNGIASDFINQASKNATPSNDAGRVAKLEADGKISVFFTKNGQIVNAGATINGATLPVPVYQNKTDNEVYACDANDATKYKFVGFAISDGTDGNPITVQFSGVVAGFSGLDEGEKYYLSDTVGTISTTPGTQEILVGVAISTTELFILKGPRFANGVASFGDAGNAGQSTDSAITLGFRPSVIRMRVYGNVLSSDSDVAHSSGTWVNGTHACVYLMTNSGGTSQLAETTSYIGRIYGGNNSEYWQVIITSVTDTGFTIRATQQHNTPTNISLEWEAEGHQ